MNNEKHNILLNLCDRWKTISWHVLSFIQRSSQLFTNDVIIRLRLTKYNPPFFFFSIFLKLLTLLISHMSSVTSSYLFFKDISCLVLFYSPKTSKGITSFSWTSKNIRFSLFLYMSAKSFNIRVWVDPRDVKHIDKYWCIMGAQWLSGILLDSRPRGRGFEPHRRHCVVVLEQDTLILA